MLQIKNVSKTFFAGTVNERCAIDNLNLSIAPGEFVTVIGGNGAGKSTLLKLISGNYLPDSGNITIDGTKVTYLPEHKRAKFIGHLFQDPLMGTAPNMTIEENLSLAFLRGKRRGLSLGVSRRNSTYFEEILASLDLGLESRLKTRMGLLSGGQRQAITLLMATIATPKLLLLDEHTAALDPATADKVLALTKRIVEKDKITTLMITHNIASALECGSRTIMLEQGKLILDISGDERKNMSVPELLELFRQKSGKELDNDRILLG